MRSLQTMGLRAQEESEVPGGKEGFVAEKPEVEKGKSTPPAVCNMESFRSWQVLSK